MTDASRHDTLRKLLERKNAELLADLRRAMGEQREEKGRMAFELAQDDGDKSVDEHERHVQSSMQSMLAAQLDDIEQALVKLGEGSYGICQECGENIPLQRLVIQPCASCCVGCQEKLERQSRRDTLWNKEIPSTPEDSYDYLPDDK